MLDCASFLPQVHTSHNMKEIKHYLISTTRVETPVAVHCSAYKKQILQGSSVNGVDTEKLCYAFLVDEGVQCPKLVSPSAQAAGQSPNAPTASSVLMQALS